MLTITRSIRYSEKVWLMPDILWILYFQWLFNVKLKMHFESEVMKVEALTIACAGEWLSMLNILALSSVI